MTDARPAPVTWKKLEDDAVRGDSITLRDVAGRLDRLGDPWAALRS